MRCFIPNAVTLLAQSCKYPSHISKAKNRTEPFPPIRSMVQQSKNYIKNLKIEITFLADKEHVPLVHAIEVVDHLFGGHTP